MSRFNSLSIEAVAAALLLFCTACTDCGGEGSGDSSSDTQDAAVSDRSAPDTAALPDTSALPDISTLPDSSAPPDISTLPDQVMADAGAPFDASSADLLAAPDASVEDRVVEDRAPGPDAGPSCQIPSNAGFEELPGVGDETPPGWSLVYPGGTSVIGVDGSWSLDLDETLEGARSLRLHPEPGHTFILYQQRYLYERTGHGSMELAVSVEMRHQGLAAVPPLGVILLALDPEDSTTIGSMNLNADGPSGSWRHYSDTLSLAASEAVLHILVGATGDVADDPPGQAWIDDLRIEPTPCVEGRLCPLVELTTPVDRAAAVPSGFEKFDWLEDPASPVLHHAYRYHPTDNPSGEWYEPVPLDGPINTAGAEDAVFVPNDDNDTLYFYFTPTFSIEPGLQILMPEEGIWSVQRTGSGQSWIWGVPEKVWLFDTLAGEGCPFVLGDTMWSCSAACPYEGMHHFTSTRSGGGWGLAALAGTPLDSEQHEIGELHITEDENQVRWIYFHSSRADGHGDLDLWVTREDVGGWSEPVNLGAAVNSVEYEGYPFVSADGLELWFSGTSRDGGYYPYGAIFRSVRQGWDDVGQVWTWGAPEEIITRYAGEPTLDADGNIYFTHHFYDLGVGGLVESDIYVAWHR